MKLSGPEIFCMVILYTNICCVLNERHPEIDNDAL
jgi:hypothetical protein